MLLAEPYNAGMPARPAVMEIFGNCFSRLGHKVTWIMPAREGVKEVQQGWFDGAHIFTIPYHEYADSPLYRKILAKLLFTWKEEKLTSKIIQEEGCNIIQARDDIFTGLLAIYLKRKHKIPFVFQYSFPFADGILEKYKLGSGKLLRLVAKLARLMLPYIMRRADLILPVSKWMQENLASEGIPKNKMMPLPLGANTTLFSPTVDGEGIRLKHNFGNSAVVIYIGTLDKLRHLDILIYALEQVKQSKCQVKLLILGQGDDRANLEKLAGSLGLGDDVIFADQIPYFKVSQFIAAADIGVSPVPPFDVYKANSPSKLFEYMGVGKPVIANEEIFEQKEVLEQSGGGISVPFTPEAFAQAIVELLEHPKKATEMGQKGREWVVKTRSYDILAPQVEKKYFELLQ